MTRSRISIVIPLLNEADNIPLLHERLAVVGEAIDVDVEWVFVDDGSTDGSADVIALLATRDDRVKLVSFSRNFGHQAAITAGLDHATGDAVIMMDADLQHPPELIETLVARWREGYEVVYTVREATEGANVLKRGSSRAFYWLFNCLTGIDMPANAADFRLLDRKVVLALGQIRERTRFMRGLTSWVGFRSCPVPYIAAARHEGVSKYNWRRMINFALDGILSFSTIPLHVGIYLGMLMAVAGFGYMGFVVVAWATGWSVIIPGWTSMIMMVSIVGGLQLIILGIIGLYVGKIFEEVKQRPLYLVRRTLGWEATRAVPAADNERTLA
jgi:dolichol-phosphate mannosyltransferase